MNKKKNEYFVRIDKDFLFDETSRFKSKYTPWIYTYLKLEHNYYIQQAPYKTISLKTDELALFFNIDRATVHRSINELINANLLIRKERDAYTVYAECKKYDKNYIKVYKNLFIDIFNNGGTISEAIVYYYMIMDNRHYAFEDYNYLKSNLTQTKLSRLLKFDSRKTKAIMKNLLALKLLTYDDETKMYMTRYPQREAFLLNNITNNTAPIAVDRPVTVNDKIPTIDNGKKQDCPVYSWVSTTNRPSVANYNQ